ncbi:MAG: hypothetical protein K0R78_3708, partial [Pelosinus sp.]|nr:hypothetical protein [Pelosinus sp.]
KYIGREPLKRMVSLMKAVLQNPMGIKVY